MRKVQEFILKRKTIFVGLEDSKKTWKICVRHDDMIVHETSLPADYSNLIGYFRNRFPECLIKVIYEAGFRGFGLHDRLVAAGISCVVTPPNKVTIEKDQRHKNDRIDSKRLAKILENGDYKTCYVPDCERREDRQVSRTLIQIQKDMTATRNRIRKFLEYHGISENLKSGSWSRADYKRLRELTLSDPLQFSLDIQLTHLEQLEQYRVLILRKLEEISEKERYNETFEIFKSAPGVGWLTAIRLVLEWGEDLSRFPNAKHFGSFVGLTCSEYSTGEQVRYGRITRQSAPFIRAWLIQCAWIAYRRDPVLLHKFQQVVKNNGNRKKAVVAVARKLAVRLYRCAMSKQQYCIGLIE